MEALDPVRRLFASGRVRPRTDPAAIEAFIDRHRPLPRGVALADAPFWTPSQAQFLRDEILEDADWAELVDALNLRLSG